jgi:hypothetical protein
MVARLHHAPIVLLPVPPFAAIYHNEGWINICQVYCWRAWTEEDFRHLALMPDAQDFSRSGKRWKGHPGRCFFLQGRVPLDNVRTACLLGRAVITAPRPDFKRAGHLTKINLRGAAPPDDNCNPGFEIPALTQDDIVCFRPLFGLQIEISTNIRLSSDFVFKTLPQ